jgi:predicted small lipoprotein YifL
MNKKDLILVLNLLIRKITGRMIMKRMILMLSVLVLTISLVGCGSKEDDGKLNLPFSSNDLKDANYQDVVAKFENAGFTNVQTKVIDDLVLGWFTKDGEIEDVSVDGYTTFSTDSRYPADIEIIVSYHTFPTDEVEEPSHPEATVEAAPTEKATVVAAPTEKAQSTAETPSSAVEEIITVDNNDEFAAVLNAKDPGDQIIKEFAVKYAGRIIKFDGNIAYMGKHGNYTTRYDFLILPWDYSETFAIGPYFKFEDCNIFDLNLIGDNIPDFIGIGDNLHFVARIKSYDENLRMFYLEPISSEVR